MLALEMNDAGHGWDTDTHAYGWAGKIADAARIHTGAACPWPGHAHSQDQGQRHAGLGTHVFKRVRAGRACKWNKGILPQKLL